MIAMRIIRRLTLSRKMNSMTMVKRMRMAYLKDMEHDFMLVVSFMKGNSKMERKRAKESKHGHMMG